MKIFLVTPLCRSGSNRWLPLGISYISSLLKANGHDVKLYDRFQKAHEIFSESALNIDMKDKILDFSPDLIGFSTVSPLVYDTLECVNYIRDFYTGKIILGGHHATAMPLESFKKIPYIDYVAVGEAEQIMLSLAEGKDPEKIQGLVTEKKNLADITRAQNKNLDELPIPDYEIFNMQYYTQPTTSTLRGFFLKCGCVLSSRGCKNNCKFCSESLSFGKGVRYHSPDYVIDNINKLLKNYDIEGIYFHDNDFLSSHEHAESICNNIIKHNLHRKLKWVIQASARKINDDILKLLSEAGCVKIELGVESVKDETLKLINKNSEISSSEKALDLCRKNNIKVHAYFMTGFEDETISDLEETLLWIKKHRPHSFSFSTVKIYPGTLLYKEKGKKYFEKNPWTREKINNYFSTSQLGEGSFEDKNRWISSNLKPFQKRYRRIALLKTNSITSIIKMTYNKLIKKEINIKNTDLFPL